MSPTPPISSATRTSANDTGDGMTLNVVEARGARRTGAIWILAISLSLAIVALGAYLLIQAPRMAAVNHPSGQDLNTRDVRNLYAAPPTPHAADPNRKSAPGI